MMQFTTQRVLCWHLLLEEFNLKFEYLMGECNIIAWFEVSKSVVLNLHTLTMIDPITNLLEIVHLP